MRKRGFRPVVDAACLEDRLVLSHGRHLPGALLSASFVPAQGFLSSQRITTVGPPGNSQAQVVAKLSSISVATINIVSAAISQDFQIAAEKQAINAAAATSGSTFLTQSITLLSTNLEAGLKAATAIVPDGDVLYTQLTAPTSQLGQIIAGLQALNPATVTVAQVTAVSNPATILAARDDALRTFVKFLGAGVANRSLLVIGAAPRSGHLHVRPAPGRP
jgi:hypothetical protein